MFLIFFYEFENISNCQYTTSFDVLLQTIDLLISQHRMGLSWSCWSVSKNCGIATLHDSPDERSNGFIVYFFPRFFSENSIKGIFLLFAPVVDSKHGSIFMLELFFDGIEDNLMINISIQSYCLEFGWRPILLLGSPWRLEAEFEPPQWCLILLCLSPYRKLKVIYHDCKSYIWDITSFSRRSLSF